MTTDRKKQIELEISNLQNLLDNENERIARNKLVFGEDNLTIECPTTIIKDNFTIIVDSAWDLDRRIIDTFDDIQIELKRAIEKFQPIYSLHEAYGIIMEEVQEFFDEVKKQKSDMKNTKTELIQIATMCIRTIYDLCYKEQLLHG